MPSDNEFQTSSNSDLPSLSTQTSVGNVTFNGAAKDEFTGKFISPEQAAVAEMDRQAKVVNAAQQVTPPSPQSAPLSQPAVISPAPRVEQPAPILPPAHSPIALDIARRMGIPDQYVYSVTPEQLRYDIELMQVAQRQQPAPPVPVAPPAPVIDWGVNPETQKPYTEKDYPPAIVEAAKAKYEYDRRIAAIEAENKQFKQQFQQTVQQQQQAQLQQYALQQTEYIASQYPQIYGQGGYQSLSPKDHEIELGRRGDVYNLVTGLLQAGRGHEIQAQVESLTKRFGYVPAPQAAQQPPNGRITPEQWSKAGLANPTHRDSTRPAMSRREQLLREEYERRRESGQVFHPGFNNNSDLPHIGK